MNGIKTFLIVAAFIVIAAAGIFYAKSKSTKDDGNGTVAVTNESGQVAGTTTTNSNSTDREVISTASAEIIYFYSETCPHCKVVKKFILDNDIDKMLPLQYREVNDKTNQALFNEKQNQCKDLSDEDKGGVPFMYTPEKCIIGDTPIIDYFKTKLGM